MKKTTAKMSLLTLCAAAILVVPALSRAQDNATPPAAPTPPAAAQTPPAAPKTPPARKHTAPATVPFHGKLAAVDTKP